MGSKKLFAAVLLLCASALAQNNLVPVPPVFLGPSTAPRLGANLTITFCTSTATGAPCTPLAQAYSDTTNSNPINQGATPLKTDSLGNAPVFYAAPGQYSFTVTGPGVGTPQGPYQITVSCIPGTTCVATTSNNTFTGNNIFTGLSSVPNINHQRKADGTTYTFAGAGLLQGYADCVADPNCSEFSTDGIITAGLGSNQLNLVAGKALVIKYGSSITGSAARVVTYPPGGATILGSSSDISNGSFSAIIATTAGSSPIGPASSSQNTQGLLISHADFWNQALNSTATLCDFTNVSNSTFISMHCQRSSASGTPSNILVQCLGASCAAFHNDFFGSQAFGPGVSWDFEAPAGAASGPNGQHIYGGRGDSGTICIGVNLGGSTSIQMNGLSFSDFDCEAYSATGYSVQGPMVNTNLNRVRFESPSPAVITNIANLGSIGVTNYWGPGIFGSGQGRGTENGKVSWRGYQQGAPGPTTEDFLVGSISALSFIQQNGGTPSTFTNTSSGGSPDIVQFSGDATGNSNCIRQINTHTGGHSVCQGEIAQVGRYGWRDGSAGFFDVDFAAGGTGELSIEHTCTSARCQVSPINDPALTLTGTKCVVSQKAETGADATLLSCTPASVAGTYRVCISMAVSAQNTATLGWTATWTDSNGSAQAPTNLALSQTGVAAPALTFTAATNGNYNACFPVDINNAGTAIVVKTTFSGTSIAYKASAAVERIQ